MYLTLKTVLFVIVCFVVSTWIACNVFLFLIFHSFHLLKIKRVYYCYVLQPNSGMCTGGGTQAAIPPYFGGPVTPFLYAKFSGAADI